MDIAGKRVARSAHSSFPACGGRSEWGGADDLRRETRALHARRLGLVGYAEALALQEELLARCETREEDETLLLLEHPPVYTLGRGADAGDLLGAPERLAVPVFRVGRGGGATFHGPGQLVAYPIVRLSGAGRDVHGYVRTLERALIATCDHFSIAAHTPPGQTGVWVGGDKLGSIGIGVRRGVAYHGIALNVCTDLNYFAHIVACRGTGKTVTSFAALLAEGPTVAEVGLVFAEQLAGHLGFAGVSLAGES
jgi:lipoyl(octanoyl) transferase